MFSTPLFELSHNVFSSHCVRRLEKHVLREAKCREDGNIFNRLFFEIIRISSNWIKPLKGTFKNICNKKATMSKRSFFFPLLHKKGSWGQILVIHKDYKGKWNVCFSCKSVIFVVFRDRAVAKEIVDSKARFSNGKNKLKYRAK